MIGHCRHRILFSHVAILVLFGLMMTMACFWCSFENGGSSNTRVSTSILAGY